MGKKNNKTVAVPLRGSYLLNAITTNERTQAIRLPSPYGVLIFLTKARCTYNIYSPVAVPLRGSYLLNNIQVIPPLSYKVAVPLRGSYLLNQGQMHIQYLQSRCRPLTGFLSS